MPEGKMFGIEEYPELEGIEAGAQIPFRGIAMIEDGENGKTVSFESLEFETENQADRSLRDLKGDRSAVAPKSNSEDF